MERTKQEVKPEQVTRRGVEWRDFELFKAWRNSPHIYQTMVENARPLSDEEIAVWIGSYINDEKHEFGMLDVIYVDGKPVGWQLARDFESGIPEVGAVITDRELWDAGFIMEMDKIGIDRLKKMGFTKVRAKTRKDNLRVLGVIPKQGYTKVFENENEIIWIRDI
jgi:RimJ/RimL family protein N-acetyltransferase